MVYSTRRQFLATTGAVTFAATTAARATNGDSGTVVFTYDDGPIEDYTQTFEVHQRYDAPACVAVCPELMRSSDDYLDSAHVGELHEAGWEILSHTLAHRSIGRVALERDAAAGDDRLYVRVHRHGRYDGDPLTVFDGKRSVTATSAGRGTDEGNAYVELEEGLDESIEADDGYVRYTEPFLREILAESKARIEAWGVPVTGFVYPYGRYHGVAEDLVPEYYDAVPNHRTGRGGLNPIGALDPTRMIRRYIETDRSTPDEIDEFMSTVAERDVVGVVGGHSQFDTLPAERVDLALELAEAHDLRIVTLREALVDLDILERPDPIPKGRGDTDDDSSRKQNDTGRGDSDGPAGTDGESSADEDDVSAGAEESAGFGFAATATAVVGGGALIARRLASIEDEER